MSNILTQYASTTSTVITVSLAGLANAAGRQSASVSNVASQYLDVLLRISTKGIAGSAATLDVYAYAAAESTAPIYTDGATGSDAIFTVANLLNSPLLGQVTLAGAASVVAGPWAIGAAFGGNIPPVWGLIFINSTGQALDATAGNHQVVYQGVYGLSQ